MTNDTAEGWRAADVDPAELVDDAWIAANTTLGKKPSRIRHAGGRALQAVRTLGVDPLEGVEDPAQLGPVARRVPRAVRKYGLIQRGGLTRDAMRRIAARNGYPYVEAWSGHNRGAMKGVWGALLHHTGTPWSAAGDYPTLKVVRDGRPGLENSLSAFGLGRSGTTYLISEKLSWHAGEGFWNGLSDGNGYLAGIEAESDGTRWTPEQVDAYPRLAASILIEIQQDDRYTTRHATWARPAGRKTDFAGWPGGVEAFWKKVYFYLAHPEQIDRNHRATVDEVHAILKENNMAVVITASGTSKEFGARVPALSVGRGSFMGLGSPEEQKNARAALPELWVESWTWDALAREAQQAREADAAAIETRDLQRKILAALTTPQPPVG